MFNKLFIILTVLCFLYTNCNRSNYPEKRMEAIIEKLDTGTYITKIDTIIIPKTEIKYTIGPNLLLRDTIIKIVEKNNVNTITIKEGIANIESTCKDTIIYNNKEILKIDKSNYDNKALWGFRILVIIIIALLIYIIIKKNN